MQFDSTRGHSNNGVDGEQTFRSEYVPGEAIHLHVSFNDSTTNCETTACHFTLQSDMNYVSTTLKSIAATYRSTTIQLLVKKEKPPSPLPFDHFEHVC